MKILPLLQCLAVISAALPFTWGAPQEILPLYVLDEPLFDEPLEATPDSFDTNKIIGGAEATPHEFPFIVSLQSSLKGLNLFNPLCGGSIYNENYIITAAHCVSSDDLLIAFDVRVVAAEQDLDVVSGWEQVRFVKAITLHPDFNLTTFRNDIAMLELDSPLVFNDKISAIAVPSTEAPLYSRVTTAGWGKRGLFAATGTPVLHKATVNVFPNLFCSATTGLLTYPITDSMLCAGIYVPIFGAQGNCQGDSGGPLFSETKPPQLVGIVSWGVGCALLAFPQTYTRVSSFTGFIATVARSTTRSD